jgi:hypothetical protein
MAEPVSAFPNPTPPTAPVKGQTVPWPTPVEPIQGSPEISGSNTETAVPELSARLGAGVQDYYDRVQRALSDVVGRSRRRFRHMAQEQPMQIVIGVAIASLLAGAALRIWRSHHD